MSTNTNTPQRNAAGYELYDLMAFAARAWPYSDYMKRYVASTWGSAAPLDLELNTNVDALT